MFRSRPNKTNPEIWARYEMPFMENLPSLHIVAQLTPQSVLGLFTSIACNWRTYMAIVTSASQSVPHSVEWINSFRRHSKEWPLPLWQSKRSVPTLSSAPSLAKSKYRKSQKRSRMPFSLLVSLYSYTKIWGDEGIISAA